MLMTYFTAIASMIAITCFWVAVQRLWRGQFPAAEEDALANRSGCHGCSCEQTGCQRENINPNKTTAEVREHAS